VFALVSPGRLNVDPFRVPPRDRSAAQRGPKLVHGRTRLRKCLRSRFEYLIVPGNRIPPVNTVFRLIMPWVASRKLSVINLYFAPPTYLRTADRRKQNVRTD